MNDDLKDVRRELILQNIQRNADYSESILKWCNTTIFALNGGALVTLFGNFSDLSGWSQRLLGISVVGCLLLF